MIKTENFTKIEIGSAQELRDWLNANHTQQDSVWLVTFKKTVPQKYVSTSEVLDELLSFGWIDGIRRKLDDYKTMQLIAPRKTEYWTMSYKTRAARLIKEGRMQAAGLKAIELSKTNGAWNFMDDVDKLKVPVDLNRELARHQGATEFFETINPSSKRFALRWVKLAKMETTRLKRIQQLAVLASQGKKLPGS